MINENAVNPGFIVLDVQTPREFAECHIPRVVNLGYKSGSFTEGIMKLDENLTYLVYCRTGMRSAAAAALMTKNDFNKVYNMAGGITQWQSDGLPTVK